MSYDEAGRLASERHAEQAVQYAYDPGDLLISVTTPTGERLSFAYDDDARLSELRDWQGQAHRIEYAAHGNQVSHWYPNGLATERHLLPEGLVSEIRTANNRAGHFSAMHVRINYTPSNQIYGWEDSEAGVRYHSYDAAGRLVAVQSQTGDGERFSYDASGNREAASGIVFSNNALNQVTRCGPLSYTYDARGNLSSESGPAGVTLYRYNGQNLLVEVVLPAGSVVRYEYDAFGRRTLKKTSTHETHFVWSRDQLLREITVSGESVEQRDYLFIPGSHEPLSMRIDGVTYQFHNDQQGTPRWLSGPNGEIVWSGSASAFGHVFTRWGAVRQPFRFPGQYFDEESGLHYNRARYYSPLLGRYLSRDPVELVGGVNFYVYAGNDPINNSDPLGLFAWAAGIAAAAGIVVGAVVVAALLPAIAVTGMGLLAAAGVVAGAALIGGCVSALATDVITDGCIDCMRASFWKGAKAGAEVGIGVVMIALAGPMIGPALALAGGAAAVVAATGSGASLAIGAAAAAGALVAAIQGKDGSGSGGSGDDKPPDNPHGPRAKPHPNDKDPENARALQRQNESADTLAKNGHDVEQLPESNSGSQPGQKHPDFNVDGEPYDNYSPTSGNPRNIASNIQNKVDSGQADRIVLNLDDCPATTDSVVQQLQEHPIDGLQDLKIVRNGEVTQVPLKAP